MSYIGNRNNITLISGTASADNICNYWSNVTLEGNAGNDTIVSFSDDRYASINDGNGNDTIQSWSPGTFMLGGDDKNYLYAGRGATVVGGDNNDEIITCDEYALLLLRNRLQ